MYDEDISNTSKLSKFILTPCPEMKPVKTLNNCVARQREGEGL